MFVQLEEEGVTALGSGLKSKSGKGAGRKAGGREVKRAPSNNSDNVWRRLLCSSLCCLRSNGCTTRGCEALLLQCPLTMINSQLWACQCAWASTMRHVWPCVASTARNIFAMTKSIVMRWRIIIATTNCSRRCWGCPTIVAAAAATTTLTIIIIIVAARRRRRDVAALGIACDCVHWRRPQWPPHMLSSVSSCPSMCTIFPGRKPVPESLLSLCVCVWECVFVLSWCDSWCHRCIWVGTSSPCFSTSCCSCAWREISATSSARVSWPFAR